MRWLVRIKTNPNEFVYLGKIMIRVDPTLPVTTPYAQRFRTKKAAIEEAEKRVPTLLPEYREYELEKHG